VTSLSVFGRSVRAAGGAADPGLGLAALLIGLYLQCCGVAVPVWITVATVPEAARWVFPFATLRFAGVVAADCYLSVSEWISKRRRKVSDWHVVLA
jgi:hypothetical protein